MHVHRYLQNWLEQEDSGRETNKFAKKLSLKIS
jgi:hypothetical protein